MYKTPRAKVYYRTVFKTTHMPSQNTVTKYIQKLIRILTRSQTRVNDTPRKRKEEFSESIKQLSRKKQANACVYVHDDTYGWVLVKAGFGKEEAEAFAKEITEFHAFGSSVSPLDVIVTSHPPKESVVTYEEVYNELSAPVKSGVRNALAEYLEN